MAHDVIYDPDALKCCPNNNPLIDFAGHKWWTNFHWSKKSGPYVWGGSNPKEPEMGTVFDPYLATVWQSGAIKGIKLEVQPPNTKYKDTWRTSEVCLMDNLGYGRYLVSAGTGVGTGFASLDPNVVFGVFTYQFTEAPGSEGRNVHREIDALEVLRGDNSNAQFMLQPWDNRPPGLYFNIPEKTSKITVTLDWYLDASEQKVAKFALYGNRYSFSNLPPVNEALAHFDATNSSFKDLIPSHGWERFHFNLWLMHGKAPQNTPQEVVIDGFEYLPPPGT